MSRGLEARAASGGTPPYHWTSDDATLPQWAMLSDTGVVGGTPPRQTVGPCGFTARVTDSASVTATKDFALTVRELENATLPDATVGRAYQGSRESASGVRLRGWSDQNSLQGGVGLAREGVLTGAPATAGMLRVSARVESEGQEITEDVTLVVKLPADRIGDSDADRGTLARGVLRTVRVVIDEYRDARLERARARPQPPRGDSCFSRDCLGYGLLCDRHRGAGASVLEIGCCGGLSIWLARQSGLLSRLYSESTRINAAVGSIWIGLRSCAGCGS